MGTTYDFEMQIMCTHQNSSELLDHSSIRCTMLPYLWLDEPSCKIVSHCSVKMQCLKQTHSD